MEPFLAGKRPSEETRTAEAAVRATDFSLIRNFKLWESKALQFRAEIFDIFNQPNFALPNADGSSTSFGVIGNTVQPIAGQASGGPGDPREVQFALRLTW